MRTAELPAQTRAALGRPFAASIARVPLSFRPSVAAGIRMRVHVATNGPEPGNWTIAIENGACRVFVGSVPCPDARLYTDSEVGRAILEGITPIDEALASRLLDYDGDLEALRHFRACFEFGDSP